MYCWVVLILVSTVASSISAWTDDELNMTLLSITCLLIPPISVLFCFFNLLHVFHFILIFLLAIIFIQGLLPENLSREWLTLLFIHFKGRFLPETGSFRFSSLAELYFFIFWFLFSQFFNSFYFQSNALLTLDVVLIKYNFDCMQLGCNFRLQTASSKHPHSKVDLASV